MDVEPSDTERARLRRVGLRLEWATNVWNLIEVFITVTLGVIAGSLALVAFGLDSLIEVFASTVVIVHLRNIEPDIGDRRTHRALRLIATAFFALSLFLIVMSARSMIASHRPDDSPIGIAYLAVTACVMFTLAYFKRRVALRLRSEPLGREAAMTLLDGCLSIGILTALALNSLFGWWWADALAALGIGIYAAWEGLESWRQGAPHAAQPIEP